MSVQVTSSGDVQGANRVVVRTSTGIVYVLSMSGSNLQAFKGNAQPPTTFAEQDAGNAPDIDYIRMAACIDSADIIHCCTYWDDPAAMQAQDECRYHTFHTADAASNQDTWQIVGETVQDLTNSNGGTVDEERLAICVDTNDDPHIAYMDREADMGNQVQTSFYTNRIGGSPWSTKIQMQKLNVAGDRHVGFDIIIGEPTSTIGADRPIVLASEFRTGTDRQNNAYHGNALDATSMVEETNIGGVPENGILHAQSMVIDNNGKITVSFVEDGTQDLQVVEHLASSAWTSWETVVDVDTATNWAATTLALNGNDRYLFVIDPTNEITLFESIGGGSWSENSTLESGDFDELISKWAAYANNEETIQIDYVFEDANAIKWNKFVLSAAPAREIFQGIFNASVGI